MAAGNKKVDDSVIIGYNSVGISLGGIAKRTKIHHTTVTHRLKELGIPPADTRRAFMEDIFDRLSPAQQDWLINQMGPGRSIKDFVRSLIIKEFIAK
jgi:hypothetical protein